MGSQSPQLPFLLCSISYASHMSLRTQSLPSRNCFPICKQKRGASLHVYMRGQLRRLQTRDQVLGPKIPFLMNKHTKLLPPLLGDQVMVVSGLHEQRPVAWGGSGTGGRRTLEKGSAAEPWNMEEHMVRWMGEEACIWDHWTSKTGAPQGVCCSMKKWDLRAECGQQWLLDTVVWWEWKDSNSSLANACPLQTP